MDLGELAVWVLRQPSDCCAVGCDRRAAWDLDPGDPDEALAACSEYLAALVTACGGSARVRAIP